jgi:hypothetical protein
MIIKQSHQSYKSFDDFICKNIVCSFIGVYMKNLYRFELKRLLHSIGFWVALCTGMIISIIDIIFNGIPMSKYVVEPSEALEYTLLSPIKVCENWMGATYYWNGKILLLMLPLLATMPFAYTFYKDNVNGVYNSICTRISKKYYKRCKFVVTFLSGAFVTGFPFLFNYMAYLTLMPSINPEPGSVSDHLGTKSYFADIYYEHVNVYILVSIIMIALFGGAMAVTALYASFYVNKIYTVYVYPCLLYIGMICLCDILGIQEWEPNIFLDSSINYQRLVPFIVEFIIVMLVAIYEFFVSGRNKEGVGL